MAKSRAALRLVHDEPVRGPSESFIRLSRNPELAANPPARFVATVKQDGDVVI